MTLSLAVAHPLFYRPTKRDALLFDRIALTALSGNIGELRPEAAAEVEWLVRRDIVMEAAVTLNPDGDDSSSAARHDVSRLFGFGSALQLIANGAIKLPITEMPPWLTWSSGSQKSDREKLSIQMLRRK